MIFLHPLPNLEAAAVLYLIVTIIFQVYAIKNSPEYSIRTNASWDMYYVTFKTTILISID